MACRIILRLILKKAEYKLSNLNIKENFSLSTIHTFGVDVKARYLVEVSDYQQFKSSHEWALAHQLPILLLGGGSNVLFTKDWDGLVIRNTLKGIQVVKEDDNHVWVEAAAGEVWHDLVLYTIDHSWGGIENLSLIPGSVGAAPMQNIGAYGVEIKDVFDSLLAMDRKNFELKTFNNEACQFGYRESVFKKECKDKYAILSVTLKLDKKPKINTSYGAISQLLIDRGINSPSIRDVSDAVISIRQSKLPDPASIGNAGSFFKNPVISLDHFNALLDENGDIPSYPQPDGSVKVPAGWLIEQCGWKGKRHGDIGVHQNQALVLVNYGSGKGEDLVGLAKKIMASVKERFRIQLTEEVNII